MIVCVAPNPAIDKLFAVKSLEPGEIHRPVAFERVPGGKGLNVARAAATLGAEVRVVALLGGDHGRWVADELAALELPLTSVWYDGETRSCLSVADGASQSLTEFYEDAAPVTSAQWRAFVDRVGEASAGATWVTVSGSLPPGASADGYAQLLRGENFAVDTTQLGTGQPALLKVNAAEAGELTGRTVATEDDALVAARTLRERLGGDGKAVVVTRGANGALLVEPAGGEWQGRLDSWGPYPVGSGDAFFAGLAVSLERNACWPDALKAALGAGAANAELPGAGRLERGRAELLAARARIQRVGG